MAAKEHLTEQIEYLNDLLRLFWVSLLAIGGGTASLLLGEFSILKIVFAAGGIVAIIVSTMIMRRLDSRIRELLEQPKEV
jgi:hypothetical protein